MLKCVHALLMHAQAEEEDRAAEVMTATLESMLGKGLEANLVDGACAHLLGETPARPEDARKNPSVSKDWSELALEETRVMLECVFLMYYDRRTKCASATFARLARAFERGALGGAPAAAAELVRYAQQMGGQAGRAAGYAQQMGAQGQTTESWMAQQAQYAQYYSQQAAMGGQEGQYAGGMMPIGGTMMAQGQTMPVAGAGQDGQAYGAQYQQMQPAQQ